MILSISVNNPYTFELVKIYVFENYSLYIAKNEYILRRRD